MQKSENTFTQKLWEKSLISEAQFIAINEYRSQNIFSIRNEIRFLLFLSVTLFTAGCGIFIYSHIDNIGHMAILGLILLVAIACYYYSFKMAPGFSKQAQLSPKVIYDYLVLGANILGGLFIGYLQYQYSVFGSHHDLATLLTTSLYFFGAYYFDHKGVLSLAITGICAFIGFSASPSSLLHNQFYEEPILAYYGIGVSLIFVLWTYYAEKQNLKKHFNSTFQNFALHILGVACITLLFYSLWLIPFFLLVIGVYYFTRIAYKVNSMHHLVFAFIYGFVGLTVAIGRGLANFEYILAVIYLSPFYFAFSIFSFIKILRNFKKRN